jgi:hypothetical protein
MEKVLGKSWKTSLIGWVMVGAAIASVLMGKTNWVDAIVVITAGIGFIMSKDSSVK